MAIPIKGIETGPGHARARARCPWHIAFRFLPSAFRLPAASLKVYLNRAGPRNPQLTHLVEKRGALEPQPFCRAAGTTQNPFRLAQCPHNLFAFALGERTRFPLDFP